MIISLISQKGGVGKSALARLISVEFARAGWNVKVGDLDTGQGSTTKWKARRDMNGIEPEIPVEKYATVERAIRDAENFDLMVLDGPAFAERRGLTMAKASDLILLPTGYSLDDMEPQIETAYELEDKGIDSDKIIFVFCRAEGSESEDAAARRYMKKARVNVLDPVFPERASIRQAHNTGRAASEVAHPSVKDKVIPLAQAIADLMNQQQD
jgi:chromosome partitioning protein